MANYFGTNSSRLVDGSLEKVPSAVGYGKYRVFYDTFDFSAQNAAVNDTIVLGLLTVGATIWADFRLWATTAMTAGTTVTLGVVNKRTGAFSAISGNLDLTTADTPAGWTAADTVASAALPFSVPNEEHYLALRVNGATATAGVIKAEVPVTVE